MAEEFIVGKILSIYTFIGKCGPETVGAWAKFFILKFMVILEMKIFMFNCEIKFEIEKNKQQLTAW